MPDNRIKVMKTLNEMTVFALSDICDLWVALEGCWQRLGRCQITAH